MKKVNLLFWSIIIITALNSCETEREKEVKRLKIESNEILANATTKLSMDGIITSDQVNQIMNEYIKMFADSAELGNQYTIHIKKLAYDLEYRNRFSKPFQQVDKTEQQTAENTFQEYFIQQKAELYNSGYINASNEAAKSLFHKNTEKLTKQLLDSINQSLTNWVGTIDRVSLAYGHNPRDMELLKTMSPNDVIEKYPEGRDINIYINVGEKKLDQATYLAEVYQEFNPKMNERGLKPNSSLYETVLGLKEGQKVVFSAKVNRTIDTNGKNNEQFTGFNIELTDIKPTN
jgi:predicted nuclease with TOPRIM domain